MEIEKDEKILFLIHQHADPDAIGSAYFLQNSWGGRIASPTGPSGTGKNLLTFLGFELVHDIDLIKFDRIVVLDTPDPAQLEPFYPAEEKRLVIDHHSNSAWDGEVLFENRTSCCEIVYDMERPNKLTKKEGIALISGILTDTSSLNRGSSETFKTLSEIMEKSNVSLEEVKSILYDRRSYSEKIARLKGAQRVSLKEVNGLIIAKTRIGAFESSVSNYLLRGGADVSLSGSEDEGLFRISGRASEEVLKEGLDLGNIFQSLSKGNTDISGGGHPGAAVLSGEGDLKTIMDVCIGKILEDIKEKGMGRFKD